MTYLSNIQQFLRFCSVGVLNTLIDILVYNLLVISMPTRDLLALLAYTTVACTVAATNSFFCNKYWTFAQRKPTNKGEIARFALVTLSIILCNDGIVLALTNVFPQLMGSTVLAANIVRIIAIAGTFLISFLGMRLWVFVSPLQTTREKKDAIPLTREQPIEMFAHSLSVVLPAYNEEVAIADTIQHVFDFLITTVYDFEIIVVNDGSQDDTRMIVEYIAAQDTRIRLINHEHNQGCGAALVSGFEGATKDLIFYMDADGQFDIRDLLRFLPLANDYDAVIGYRIDRQDTWVRKLNAWGWNLIIRFVFRLPIRDIDCAFKLFHAEFFRTQRLEARGPLLLTEIVYKFLRAGHSYTEVGVRHLPRVGGKGTGAKPSVILRAFKELFFFAGKWFHEEQDQEEQTKTKVA